MAFLDSAQQLPPELDPAAMGQPMGNPMPMPQMEPIGGITQQIAPKAPKISKAHQKLLDWASPDMVNIAEDLDDDVLGKISLQVTRGYEVDETSLSDYFEKSDRAFEMAAQVAKQKDTPWPGASNVIYPLITTAALSFASRAYPAVIADRNVVKGVVYGHDKGTPEVGPDGQPVLEPLPPEAAQQIAQMAQQGAPLPPGIEMGPQGPGVIKWETPPGEKRKRADRIGQHMSYQLLDQKTGWEQDTDKLLHMLPIGGCYFRKTWYDPMQGKTLSTILSPRQLIINYFSKSMARAPRMSEILPLYPNEVEEKKRLGVFLDVELGEAEGAGEDSDAPHTFIEQHCWYDLDNDGYKEPYIVTYHKETSKVVRLVARYDAEGIFVGRKRGLGTEKILKIEPLQYYSKYDFIPNIDGGDKARGTPGFHGMGFGQLLNPINASINTALNMMLDAGHLQTTGGGFVGKGISMHSGSVRFKPGEYKVVNAPGQDIRAAVVNLEHPGPSPVLFQLLGLLIKSGEQMAATNDVLEGSANMAQMQPTTMLALIEQGLKVFTAIYKRFYLSLNDEFDKRYKLNAQYMEEREEYQYGDEWREVTQDDYRKGAGVCPYSDPKMVSDMQRMARAQITLSLKDDPRIKGDEAIRRALEAAEIEDIDDLFAEAPQPDPVIEGQVAKLAAEVKEIDGKVATAAVQEATERSKQVLNYAQSIKALADADATQGDQEMGWITTQLDVLRGRMEGLNGAAIGGAGGGAPQGNPLAALGGPDAGGGEGAQAQGEEEAPLDGARKAPDGNWYVPDPERQGKWLQVQAG
jgi:chaperonin GroES